MHIKNFKPGDIITRNERSKHDYGKGIGDGSYRGDRLIFLGYDEASKIIFFGHQLIPGDWTVTDVSGDEWLEGWEKYPESMYEKAKQHLKKLVGKES